MFYIFCLNITVNNKIFKNYSRLAEYGLTSCLEICKHIIHYHRKLSLLQILLDDNTASFNAFSLLKLIHLFN